MGLGRKKKKDDRDYPQIAEREEIVHGQKVKVRVFAPSLPMDIKITAQEREMFKRIYGDGEIMYDPNDAPFDIEEETNND
jgi:hypothetical protein